MKTLIIDTINDMVRRSREQGLPVSEQVNELVGKDSLFTKYANSIWQHNKKPHTYLLSLSHADYRDPGDASPEDWVWKVAGIFLHHTDLQYDIDTAVVRYSNSPFVDDFYLFLVSFDSICSDEV